MEISLSDYWMGRDTEYPLAMTVDIDKNARLMVDLANQLVERLRAAGIDVHSNPRTGTLVNSGWRPAAINSATPGAAVNSKHMTGQAIDIHDPDGDIDNWLLTAPGQSALVQIGLWMESPASTKGWCHVQSVPPRSGNRVFYP